MATDQPKDTTDESGSFVSNDHFDNPHEKALYNTQTVTDANGIERIVAPSTEVFTPAPLEASDEEKAAAERRLAMFDKASKDRQAQLTGDVPEGARAVNNPSDSGSQTAVLTNDEAAEKQAKADEAKAADKPAATTTTKEK